MKLFIVEVKIYMQNCTYCPNFISEWSVDHDRPGSKIIYVVKISIMYQKLGIRSRPKEGQRQSRIFDHEDIS